jgi:S-adenosyl-L-methionine hydrolase (adenosine-forming)
VERYELITFLSDFGWQGGYVAACEAILAAVCPHARVLHVSHEVALGDVRDGATTLARVAALTPPAVHLAVVDPGVGTERRPLALQTNRGDLLVGPDNGLLGPAAAALGGVASAWRLIPERVRLTASLPANGLSSTFHGRDLFAPAAALLACGSPIAVLAEPIPSESLATLAPALLERLPGAVRAEVVEVDRFGNVALSLRLDSVGPIADTVTVQVEGEPDPTWTARVVRTFADLKPGELGLLQDSWGHAGLTLNAASAAELLGARRGSVIRLALTTAT